VCTAPGDAESADRIAGPHSHAHIVYAVTGVCHQTANRILAPAGVCVAKARWYAASHLLYGTYGRGHWKIPSIEAVTATFGGTDNAMRAYVLGVQRLYTDTGVGAEEQTVHDDRDLVLFVDYKLGGNTANEYAAAIARARGPVLRSLRHLTERDGNNAQSASDLAVSINRLAADALRAVRHELQNTSSVFEAIYGFGEAKEIPESVPIVDPAVLKGLH
jgi:hypothetical protein